MTGAERDTLIARKCEVSEHLAAIRPDSYGLGSVDARLEAYVRDVASVPRRHNLFEQLAVERFLRMVDRYGINATAVRRFVYFYEHLHFPGKRGLQNYAATPVQVFQFASIYGFWHNGRRVVRKAVMFVPRKFSKTTSSAAFAIYDMLFGEANAESYTAANSHDQAKKCFDVIRGCVRMLDPKGKYYTVNEETIKSRRADRTAFAQCLAANARTKDGLNASTVIMDEFSQARDNSLYAVLTTSMGIRTNPLTVIITTASDVFDGPFYSMLQGCKSILLGDFEDDSVFAHLFEPDIDDAEDDENTWLKVQPHMGVTVSLDFYRQEYRNALRNGAEAMLAFRTKLLNIYAENEQRAWISATFAKSMSKDITLDSFGGRKDAMCAIDLSESDDFSAITVGIYDSSQKSFFFHTAYFFPEGALAGHPNEKLYRSWVRDGWLRLTPGDVIDYRTIVSYVLEANKSVRILGIGYDPWKSQEVINMLAASGAGSVLNGVKQTYGTFTAPVEFFEHAAKTGHISINANPINYYCFGNAVLDSDKLENCKPVKRRQYQKIDGVITMLMCMRQFLDSKR